METSAVSAATVMLCAARFRSDGPLMSILLLV
jgi:hypothetical protein